MVEMTFFLDVDGVYRPIEEDEVYTVAANDYLLEQGGDGYSMFLDNEFPVIDGMQDYQVLAAYVTKMLKGRIDMEILIGKFKL